MLNDGLKLSGDVLIERRRKDGSVIDREVLKNLILTTGKTRVRNLIGEGIGTGLTGFSYIAIGTGTDAALVGDTSLQTEVDRELATIVASGDDKVYFEKTFTFGILHMFIILIGMEIVLKRTILLVRQLCFIKVDMTQTLIAQEDLLTETM